MVEPTAVGLHAIHLADIRVGDKVLVVGSGIIGLVSAMFAKMEGASKVIVSEVNEARAKKAVKLGVADGYILANDKFNESVRKVFNDKLLTEEDADLPFIVELSEYLKLYEVINDNYYSMEELVDAVWK